MESEHMLHSKITGPKQQHTQHLKLRYFFVPAAKDLMAHLNQQDIKASDLAKHFWNTESSNC